jgi:hypothetical protein
MEMPVQAAQPVMAQPAPAVAPTPVQPAPAPVAPAPVVQPVDPNQNTTIQQ